MSPFYRPNSGVPKGSISKLPTASSFVKPVATQESPAATVIFDFTAGSAFELTVSGRAALRSPITRLMHIFQRGNLSVSSKKMMVVVGSK
jgi:hypothetical protein